MTSGTIGDIFSGITAARIKELFIFDPDTGNLFWKVDHGKKMKAGNKAGAIGANGYIYVGFDYRKFRAHRLMWLYVYGEWPNQEIDHKNGIKTDNRIQNLRLATRNQNNINRVEGVANTSGHKGVSWFKPCGCWRAYITINRKQISLGLYKEFKNAVDARKNGEKKYFGEFARAA